MKWSLLACLVLLLSVCWLAVSHANPFTCDDTANTCTYRATATEPTKTVGNAAITNYKQTNLKIAKDGGAIQTIVKPATSPGGGGMVTHDLTFATTPCAVTTLTTKASGTNTLNVEGPDSAPVTVTRDRTQNPTCAPAAPGLQVD